MKTTMQIYCLIQTCQGFYAKWCFIHYKKANKVQYVCFASKVLK